MTKPLEKVRTVPWVSWSMIELTFVVGTCSTKPKKVPICSRSHNKTLEQYYIICIKRQANNGHHCPSTCAYVHPIGKRTDSSSFHFFFLLFFRVTRWTATSGRRGSTGDWPSPDGWTSPWASSCSGRSGSRTRTSSTGGSLTSTPSPRQTNSWGCSPTGGCYTHKGKKEHVFPLAHKDRICFLPPSAHVQFILV